MTTVQQCQGRTDGQLTIAIPHFALRAPCGKNQLIFTGELISANNILRTHKLSVTYAAYYTISTTITLQTSLQTIHYQYCRQSRYKLMGPFNYHKYREKRTTANQNICSHHYT